MKHPQKPVVRRALAAALASGFGAAAALGLGLSVSAANAVGDPHGNNGTIKIVGPGDVDDIPENNPHQGCVFAIEWYGFDEGDDIVSKVSLEAHSPTDDAEFAIEGNLSVHVGDDAAGGGTDLDGREWYTLTPDGTAHHKQGFHVKVTVDTPRSKGSRNKSKVLWFQDCVTETPSETPSEPTETPTTTEPTDGGTTSAPPATGPATTEPPSEEPTTDEPTKAGPAFPEDGPGGDGAGPTDGVPTRIPAGGVGEDEIDAASNTTDVVGQPVVLGLVGLGAGMAAIGGVIGALRVRARQD